MDFEKFWCKSKQMNMPGSFREDYSWKKKSLSVSQWTNFKTQDYLSSAHGSIQWNVFIVLTIYLCTVFQTTFLVSRNFFLLLSRLTSRFLVVSYFLVGCWHFWQQWRSSIDLSMMSHTNVGFFIAVYITIFFEQSGLFALSWTLKPGETVRRFLACPLLFALFGMGDPIKC